MKKSKLIMPIIAGLTAITPVAFITSCGNGISSVTEKSLTTGDSVAYYKFKMNTKPTDNKVTVNVINKAGQETVSLYTGVSTVNSVAEYTVADDGTVIVPAGYYLAPTANASSDFSLVFTYKVGDKEKSETVNGLKFNYSIDYGANLKDEYTAKVQPESHEHFNPTSNATVGEIYMNDVVNNSAIFQDDARYSTSARIRAVGADFNVESFQSYFNDVVKENDGLHLHMNYKAKGTQNENIIQFKVGAEASDPTYTFTKFNFSFSYETPNGYTIAQKDKTADYTRFTVTDPTGNYHLDGRFSGSFTYKIDSGEAKTVTITDCLINNYSMFPKSSNTTWTDEQIAAMLSFGIIHYTYGFEWKTETPELTILSPYAKNA